MINNSYVYILSSDRNGTLYIGVSADLERRVFEHKTEQMEGFSQKYNVKKLVWFEEHPNIESAIYREKQIKKWNRKWKLELVEKNNPQWEDLAEDLFAWIPNQVGNDGVKIR